LRLTASSLCTVDLDVEAEDQGEGATDSATLECIYKALLAFGTGKKELFPNQCHF
jgi:hypothetical protein